MRGTLPTRLADGRMGGTMRSNGMGGLTGSSVALACIVAACASQSTTSLDDVPKLDAADDVLADTADVRDDTGDDAIDDTDDDAAIDAPADAAIVAARDVVDATDSTPSIDGARDTGSDSTRDINIIDIVCNASTCDSHEVCRTATCVGAVCIRINETGTPCRTATGAGVCNSGTCESCGVIGQACCERSSCIGTTTSRCTAGRCVACGQPGQACCDGEACVDYNTYCAPDARCRHCGGFGEPCCNGRDCGRCAACAPTDGGVPVCSVWTC